MMAAPPGALPPPLPGLPPAAVFRCDSDLGGASQQRLQLAGRILLTVVSSVATVTWKQ